MSDKENNVSGAMTTQDVPSVARPQPVDKFKDVAKLAIENEKRKLEAVEQRSPFTAGPESPVDFR